MSCLTLLGTGACQGVPSPFCTCELCSFARRELGRERRRRTSTLINGELLIDFGPDTSNALRDFGVDEMKIKTLCVTHSHEDHFQPLDLLWSATTPTLPLDFISNQAVKKVYDEAYIKVNGKYGERAKSQISWYEGVPGRELVSGKYRILPVHATHMVTLECALNYLVTCPDGKKVLILNDTGWWEEASFEFVKGAMADAVVIELSCGIHPGEDVKRQYHLGSKAAMEFIARLKEENSLKPDAVCVTTHISHVPQVTQSGYEEYFVGTGIIAGYDGLRLEF